MGRYRGVGMPKPKKKKVPPPVAVSLIDKKSARREEPCLAPAPQPEAHVREAVANVVAHLAEKKSSDPIDIDNGAPSITGVTIAPDPARAGDTLACAWEERGSR